MIINCEFLHSYGEDDALGPVQRSEALFLYALTLVLRPSIVLEIGSAYGHSTRCFLEAGASSVFAVDLNITRTLRRLATAFPNLTIIEGSQESFPLEFLQGRMIDLVFLDASHNFELDRQTFMRIRQHLAPTSVLVVHDTGLWRKEFMLTRHHDFAVRTGEDFGQYHIHRPEVQQFIEWLKQEGMACVNLGSQNCLRHGLSIFQHPYKIDVLNQSKCGLGAVFPHVQPQDFRTV